MWNAVGGLCGWYASVLGGLGGCPEQCERIAAAPASESALSRAWLRCLCTNTSSMGNKQEELETCMGVIPLASRSRGGVAALAGVREWKAVVGFSGEAGQGGQGAEVGPEEYGGIVQTAGDEVKKAKGQLELSVARDVKDNRKGFCRCVANKRQSRDNEGPLWNSAPAGSQSFVLPCLSFMVASLITMVDGSHQLNVVKGF